MISAATLSQKAINRQTKNPRTFCQIFITGHATSGTSLGIDALSTHIVMVVARQSRGAAIDANTAVAAYLSGDRARRATCDRAATNKRRQSWSRPIEPRNFQLPSGSIGC